MADPDCGFCHSHSAGFTARLRESDGWMWRGALRTLLHHLGFRSPFEMASRLSGPIAAGPRQRIIVTSQRSTCGKRNTNILNQVARSGLETVARLLSRHRAFRPRCFPAKSHSRIMVPKCQLSAGTASSASVRGPAGRFSGSHQSRFSAYQATVAGRPSAKAVRGA